MGYLHHANYLNYFEIGRTELLRASGGNYRQMEASGLFAVVVRADVRYRKPARYDDLLTLRTTIAEITPAKVVHHYELFRDDELLTTAKITLASDRRKGQSLPRAPSGCKLKSKVRLDVRIVPSVV